MSVHSLSGMHPIRILPTPEEQNQKLKEVSAMYEKQFLGEMVKAMRGTVQESGLVKVNQAEKIFREQLDSEYVDSWSKQGGVGLADLIHRQLVDKYGAKMGLKGFIEKPKGPITLSETSQFTGRMTRNQSEGSGQKMTYQFDRNNAGAELKNPGLGSGLGDNALKAPWGGVLQSTRKLGAEEYLLDLNHQNGLKSQLVFRGLAQPMSPGSELQAGQTIGILSPDTKSFFWTLDYSEAAVSE